MPTPKADLLVRCDALRAQVKQHKIAIRRHREELGAAKSALVELEGECRRLGIALIVLNHAVGGEGDIHGRPDRDRTSPDPRP